MKTFAIALVALLLIGGAVPMALAQQDTHSQAPAAQSAPSNPSPSPSTPSGSDMKAPGASGSVDARGSISADSKTRTDRSDDSAGAASPRTEATRTGFFGLSPTAAIIVSVAVLLVVILAIVAMTNNRGTTYIDRDRGL